MKRIFLILLIVISLFGFNNNINAQEKKQYNVANSISTGAGFPEFLNIGMHHKVDNFEFALNIGSAPEILAFSPNLCYYFNHSKVKQNKHPWYLRTGISYFSETRQPSDSETSIIREFTYLDK